MTSPTSPDCSLCSEPLMKSLVSTDCGHVFHANCISGAIELNPYCPICEKPLNNRNLIPLSFEVTSTNNEPIPKNNRITEAMLSRNELLMIQAQNDAEMTSLRLEIEGLQHKNTANKKILATIEKSMNKTQESTLKKIERIESLILKLQEENKKKDEMIMKIESKQQQNTKQLSTPEPLNTSKIISENPSSEPKKNPKRRLISSKPTANLKPVLEKYENQIEKPNASGLGQPKRANPVSIGELETLLSSNVVLKKI